MTGQSNVSLATPSNGCGQSIFDLWPMVVSTVSLASNMLERILNWEQILLEVGTCKVFEVLDFCG